MEKLKVLVIVGTTRSGRVGREVADWYIAEARKLAPENMELKLLDVADEKLDIFSEPVSPMMHQYSDRQKQLAEKISAADAFVFVTGEYNHSVPGSLKNFIDYLNAEWNHKVAAYVGYGGLGGARAIEHLVQIMSELRAASVRDYVNITTIWEALDEQGSPKPAYVHGNIEGQLKELAWWAGVLKAGRNS